MVPHVSYRYMKYVWAGQNMCHPEIWLMRETIQIIMTAAGHRRPYCSGHQRKPVKSSLLQRLCSLIAQSRQTKSRRKEIILSLPFYAEITEMLRPWNPVVVNSKNAGTVNRVSTQAGFTETGFAKIRLGEQAGSKVCALKRLSFSDLTLR